jgi:hypothetical protein
MRAFLVAELGESFFSQSKDLALIDTTELYVDIEILLVKCLHKRVEEATEWRIFCLLDNFGTRLLRVTLACCRCKPQNIHHVLGRQLEARTQDELKLVYWDANGLEQRGDSVAVVFCAVLDEFDGCLEVVEEAMDIGEEDFDVAASGKELCNLEDRDEL